MPDALSARRASRTVWLWVSSRGTSRGGEHEADDADGDVDEEDPLPAEAVDEQAAEDRADQGGDAGRRAPERHGLAARGPAGRCG